MRAYRLLLRLYPASFRTEYGAEMCRVYGERLRDAHGVVSRLRLYSDSVLDVARNALLVHLDVLRQDLRYAARTLGHAPAFALTAVAVTALGIGANTAVFSVADRVLIRSLPYADAPRLVNLWESATEESPGGPMQNEVSPANYRDWRALSGSFEALGAYTAMSANLVGTGEPLRLEGTMVTADLLPLLGTRPAAGRLFLPEEDREGAPGAVLLSYGLSQALFAGSEAALGSTLRLNDEAYTVVGVLPSGFAFPTRDTQLWTPLRLGPSRYTDRSDTYLRVVGKLGPGVSRTRAQAEMDVIGRRLERQYPQNAHIGTSVLSMRDEVSSQARLLLAALFGASLCVLLIACTNLANLLLARALARRPELAVRAALGAGRERLARQLLTESLLLSGLGGLLGIVLAAQAVPLLAALVPTTLPVGPATVLDLRVMVFATVLTTLTGVGFGVAPALRIGRGVDLCGLRESARGGGRARKRLRAALVVAEVTATVVLLVSAGLLLRALERVRGTDPGFKTDRVMALRTPLPIPGYNSTARRARLYTDVLAAVRSLPGVTSAAYVTDLPMLRPGGIWGISVPGESYGPNEEPPASLRYVSAGFFDVLEIPRIHGRDLGDSDTASSPFVAVVSESLARRHWPGKDPLGQTFKVAFADRVVVGVVSDVRVRGLEQESEPQVYLPFGQVPDGSLIGYVPRVLVYRATVDPGSLVAAVRGIVRKADPELPISEVRSLASVVDAETTPRRTQLRAIGAFAMLSLLLAGVGIYGVLSFAVSQRTREIGVRAALGARPATILRMVMGEALTLTAIGALPGMLLAYLTGRSLESILAGVKPADSGTFLAVAAVVLLVTVCGSLVPALRALRIDPVSALRAE